jgi:hypothetical protein
LYRRAVKNDAEPRRDLTKWEVLRLIKHSFTYAFIDREDKRLLLHAVEEELYQRIIHEEGLESCRSDGRRECALL